MKHSLKMPVIDEPLALRRAHQHKNLLLEEFLAIDASLRRDVRSRPGVGHLQVLHRPRQPRIALGCQERSGLIQPEAWPHPTAKMFRDVGQHTRWLRLIKPEIIEDRA